MTLTEETIERQLEELKQQYTYLENVCKGLTTENLRLNVELERGERLALALRETIKELEMKVTAAECRECRCPTPNTGHGC